MTKFVIPSTSFAAAEAFFRKALASHSRGPRKVTIDGHVPSRRALWRLRGEHSIWRKVEVRTCKYLNNIAEQDHWAIKQRCTSMAGFKSFTNASIAACRNRAGSSDSQAPVLVRSRTGSSSVDESDVGDGNGVN